MAFYDRISRQWDEATGRRGGPFKRYVLNDLLLDAIGSVEGKAVLELGAGNGYFAGLMLRRFSGQSVRRMVLSDVSERMLEIARQGLPRDGIEFLRLDVRADFPFADGEFDLLLATMVFNEIPARSLAGAFGECRRALREGGRFLVTVVHPLFVADLNRRGVLRRVAGGPLTMPAAGSLRVPIATTPEAGYGDALRSAGFSFAAREIRATEKVLSVRSALRASSRFPLALLFDCRAERVE